MKSESLEAAMARVRTRYLQRMMGRAVSLRDALASIEANEVLGNERLEELRLICHGYKGSGASYGFNDITALGARAEDALKAALAGNSSPLADALEALAEELERVSATGLSG